MISGIVLAGGRSRRMGVDKAFLDLGGQPLIEIVLGRLSRVADEIIVVTNEPEKFASLGIALVGDVYRGQGTLAGIHAGLQAARYQYSLVVACDMPFLNPNLLRFMALLAADYDLVMPRLMPEKEPTASTAEAAKRAKDRNLHPLHAIYSKACLPHIEETLQGDDWRVIAFLPTVRVRYVERDEIELFDPQHLSFFNINTPADLDRARELTNDRRTTADR